MLSDYTFDILKIFAFSSCEFYLKQIIELVPLLRHVNSRMTGTRTIISPQCSVPKKPLDEISAEKYNNVHSEISNTINNGLLIESVIPSF